MRGVRRVNVTPGWLKRLGLALSASKPRSRNSKGSTGGKVVVSSCTGRYSAYLYFGLVSYCFNQHGIIGNPTPSCVLSSYAAAKRIVSLDGFVSEIVVVVLVMFVECCLRSAYPIAVTLVGSYRPCSDTLTAALAVCQVVFADPKTSHHMPPLWHHQASTLLHLCDRQ